MWVYVLVCGFVGRGKPGRLLVLHGSHFCFLSSPLPQRLHSISFPPLFFSSNVALHPPFPLLLIHLLPILWFSRFLMTLLLLSPFTPASPLLHLLCSRLETSHFYRGFKFRYRHS